MMEYQQFRDSLSGYWPGGQMVARSVIGLSLSEAYQGGRRTIERDGVVLPVTIPAGVHTGTKVYLARLGRGNARQAEYCAVVVHNQPPFKRSGNDLHLEFSIDAFTAILGGVVTVPTLFGQTELTVPPGTAPGSTLRLPGFGMPVLGHPQTHGDLCVHLQVDVPENVTDLERKLIDDCVWLRGWRLSQHDQRNV